MVGAGSVVTRDVPDYGLAYGNPARLHGLVCPCGAKLALPAALAPAAEHSLTCSRCQTRVSVPQAVINPLVA
jgi:hypothetical protein